MIRCASELQSCLEGQPSQSVPFSAPVSSTGLLSWAREPQGVSVSLGETHGESSRVWVVSYLAAALSNARRGGDSRWISPFDSAWRACGSKALISNNGTHPSKTSALMSGVLEDPHLWSLRTSTLFPSGTWTKRTRIAAGANATDYAISKRHSRTRVKVADIYANLLLEFATPAKLLDAVMGLAAKIGGDPEELLDRSWSSLMNFIDSEILVPEQSRSASARKFTLKPGEIFSEWRIVRGISLIEDTEVYEAVDHQGRKAALKCKEATREKPATALLHERDLLLTLDGSVAPALYGHGFHHSFSYIAMEWIEGADPRRVGPLPVPGIGGCESSASAACSQTRRSLRRSS